MSEEIKAESPQKAENSKNGKRTKTVTSAKSKRPKKDIWDPDHVMTNPNSPLVNVDLRALLARKEAFDLLDAEEKKTLLNMLPDDGRHVLEDDDGEMRIDPDFLRNSVDWHHAVRCVQDDIAEGRNDPKWLKKAYTAHKQREAGKFDSWKEKELEEYWGMKHEAPASLYPKTIGDREGKKKKK